MYERRAARVGRAQVDGAAAMQLLGELVEWVLGRKPTYDFTRETAPVRLLELRGICYTLLDDLDTPAGKALHARVDTATSANQFWHMRPRLFDALSQVHGESEATNRLSKLDTVLRVHHDRRSMFARNADEKQGGPPSERRRRRDTDRSFDTTR
jgi:hypothetical protein